MKAINVVVGALGSLREPTIMTQLVLCSLAALEGADNQLLGSSARYTAPQLNFTLNAFTEMAIAQGIANNLAAPLWGIAADRNLADQKMLLITAALGQGLITIMLALVTTYGPFMIFLRAFNGLFLAGLRPIANGIVTKQTSLEQRGKIFSRVQIFILLGGSACALIVTPMAGWTTFDGLFPEGRTEQGWRIAWMMVGFLSVAVAFFTYAKLELTTPPPVDNTAKIADILCMELRIFCGFLRKPTFVFMVGQGIFGTIPWTVMWLNTLFYQLSGLSNIESGIATALAPVAGMVGVFIGGNLADVAAVKLGLHGRPLCAQLTVSLGVPFLYFHYIGWGVENHTFWSFVLLNAGFGVFGNWAQAGTNWPVLSEIVTGDVASRVMAMESAIENSCATILGPTFVAYLGKNVFFFQLSDIDDQSPADFYLAERFGACLGLTVCIPFLAAFIVYSFLHFAFPLDMAQKDREAAASQANAESTRGQESLQGFMYQRTNSTLHP